MILENKKYRVVIGLGKTGLACARYLYRNNIPFVMNDSREAPPGLADFQREFPGLQIVLGKFDEQLLAQAEELIVSPGVSLAEPAIAKQIARGVLVSGDVDLFAEQIKAPVIAITGSNGKSTVTSLVGKMVECAGLKVKVGGNIGVPVLDFLNFEQEPDLYVLELSSFQLETTRSLHPAAAVLLNICPDHLDRYASMQDYIAAKRRIYKHCKVRVVNRDDLESYHCATKDDCISFGFDAPAPGHFGLVMNEGENYLAQGRERLLPVHELKIKGEHHTANALAALALGHAVHLPMPAMLRALREFQGLPHRCQWFLNHRGIDWYNDSKATNIGAALAAILGLGKTNQGKLILIAGGIAKEDDFSSLCAPLSDYARTVILLGQDKGPIAQALSAGGLANTVQLLAVENLQEAVALADKCAQEKDIVLLSPFCASFDMFDNFEQRGNRFMQIAQNLI
jgi:UDP-N-acetylmuramoylalanine--D-glutamate ligase